MPSLDDLIGVLDQIAPPSIASPDDRSGLQIGDRHKQVHKVCVAVDPCGVVIDRAIERNADVLIAHHPLIYNPLRSVDFSNHIAALVSRLIKADVALFVMHTNFDSSPGGVNDILAQLLGLTDTDVLLAKREDHLHKIVVFVPEADVERVRNAMADAGAGRIGQYTHCSFRSPGIGSFVPLAAAQPYVGSVGKLEEVEEYRLEMICAGSWLDEVISAMLAAHPYDEVAFDVYRLANEPIAYGYGRVGNLNGDTTFKEYAEMVIKTLDVKWPKVYGEARRVIRRVAVCSGGGSSLYDDAIRAGADVYIAGDMRHHDIVDALDRGLCIIDAGHFETEKPGMVELANILRRIYPDGRPQIDYVE